jgi:hypothetical protein
VLDPVAMGCQIEVMQSAASVTGVNAMPTIARKPGIRPRPAGRRDAEPWRAASTPGAHRSATTTLIFTKAWRDHRAAATGQRREAGRTPANGAADSASLRSPGFTT